MLAESPYNNIRVRYLDLEYSKIITKRDSHFPDYDSRWTQGLSLNLGVGVGRRFFTENRVWFDMDEKNVKHIGWQFTKGLRFGWGDIFYRHHSQHGAEFKSDRPYPLDDRVGIKINLIN